MPDALIEQLNKRVEVKLQEPRPKIGLSKDIYTAFFKEGPIQREVRFYAPAADLTIEDEEKRRRDRAARIWRLCDRYVRYLRSKENRKVVFVGVPQPFVRDLEAEMREFPIKSTDD